ncbi:unnamed protein product, partial [Polarella glacialis]
MTDAAAEAERMMPSCRMLERGLLRSLASGLSAEEALLRMPRQGLMLYVKSAQSLLFNEVLSFRLREFGPDPVAADLALAADRKVASSADEQAAAGALGAGPRELPLPGSCITYPKHLKEAYEEAAKRKLGLPLEAFHCKLPPRLTLRGVYREADFPGGLFLASSSSRRSDWPRSLARRV